MRATSRIHTGPAASLFRDASRRGCETPEPGNAQLHSLTHKQTPRTRTRGPVTSNYTYDADGNPTQLPGSSTALAYDAADQLTSGPQGTYTYNNLGQRTQLTAGATNTNWGWDQAGNLTSNTGSTSSLNLSYSYDGNGLLQARTNGTTTTQLTWDPTSSIPQLAVDDGIDIIYGPDQLPLEQINGTTVTYYHHDQLGSTRLLTDTAGSTVETIDYTPYGTPTVTSGSASTDLLYAGQYTDPTSGLNYMRARWYEPTTGQFLSVDPLEALTGQPYSYADGNPVTLADPTGQDAGAAPCVELSEDPAAFVGCYIAANPGTTVAAARAALAAAATVGGIIEGLPSDAAHGLADFWHMIVGGGADDSTSSSGAGEAAAECGFENIESGPFAAEDAGLSAEDQDAIASLEKQIADHEDKLAKYIADPDAYDNRGFLRNAPSEAVRESIIAGRIGHLESEINAFRQSIERIRNGG